MKKRVDETWKEQAEREKRTAGEGHGPISAGAPRPPAPPLTTAGTGGSGEERAGARPGDHESRTGGAGRRAAQPAEEPHAASPSAETEELLQARFDLFVSGLATEALIALGDMPHPATRKQTANLPQAKYLIDLLGVLEEKTKGNLLAEEERLLKDALYQLRMRYLGKSGGS